MTDSKNLGILGEELAAHYLRSLGYKILLKNYVCPLGEIDLVARDGKGLVFIEVKTRRPSASVSGPEALTHHKRQQICKAAQYYLNRYGISDIPCRLDVLSIVLEEGTEPSFELIKDAFGRT